MATIKHTLRMHRFNMFPLSDKFRPVCSCGWKREEFTEDIGVAKADGRRHIAELVTA